MIVENPSRTEELVRCLRSNDPVVRSRAADALEKVSVKRPALLEPYKVFLLRVAATVEQQEVRWHVAQMLPRLPLTRREIKSAFSLLREYLKGRSAIVKVCAMQALAELALRDPGLGAPVRSIIETACREGTPAMRARGRRLLSGFPHKSGRKTAT